MGGGKSIGILAGSLAIAATLLFGCGGSSDDQAEGTGGNAEYVALLHGLKRAAMSNDTYHAVDRAEDLEPVLKISLNAFCDVNQELIRNGEAWKSTLASYLIVRIKTRAERNLAFVSTGPVYKAVNEYRDLFGLTSFNPSLVRRYAHACYDD